MSTTLAQAITTNDPIALLIGNGINRHKNGARNSAWEQLLGHLAKEQGLNLTRRQVSEMSNTEFFDVLDLARPRGDKSNLQRAFCDLMSGWSPTDHHRTIVRWAQRRGAPVITVNFDENLSRSIDAHYFGPKTGFTDFYPWSSYFSDREIGEPRTSFAIWHAHGMMRYARSIRLGLTHYMGSVQRARALVYGTDGLRRHAAGKRVRWQGSNTWLDALFFSPLLIMGFGFGKDETFMRWLLLERARLYKIRPDWRQATWYVADRSCESDHRRPFFEALGIKLVIAESREYIYENAAWDQ